MIPIRFSIPLALALAATVAATPTPVLRTPPIPLPGPTGWASAVDHPYFPLRPGTVLVYQTRTGKHTGADTVTVLHRTKTILGVAATVVRDRNYEGGELVEESFDWYAQDAAGNVWYLGEDTREYRAGKVVSTAGSWEAGQAGAQPGIIMWANPRPGPPYRQEFCFRVAEDLGRVLNANTWTIAGGRTYSPCVQTVDWSPLEPGVREHKFYARGVGLVREKTIAGADEEMVLAKVIEP